MPLPVSTIVGSLRTGIEEAKATAAAVVAPEAKHTFLARMRRFLNLPEGATGTATISSATNFLRGVRAAHVEAVARPLQVGRTVIVVEIELCDAEGRAVAKVTQTQAVLRPP